MQLTRSGEPPVPRASSAVYRAVGRAPEQATGVEEALLTLPVRQFLPDQEGCRAAPSQDSCVRP